VALGGSRKGTWVAAGSEGLRHPVVQHCLVDPEGEGPAPELELELELENEGPPREVIVATAALEADELPAMRPAEEPTEEEPSLPEGVTVVPSPDAGTLAPPLLLDGHFEGPNGLREAKGENTGTDEGGSNSVSVMVDKLGELPLVQHPEQHVEQAPRRSSGNPPQAPVPGTVLSFVPTAPGVLPGEPLPPAEEVIVGGEGHAKGITARGGKAGAALVDPPSPLSRTMSDSKLAREKPNESLGAGDMKEILGLALPALGAVIADPLMSLVDTACVGQISSLHLAALGPNTAVFNFVFQVFTFLGVGTTALIARNSLSAAGITSKERRHRRIEASRTMANSLVLAVGCGLACTLALQAAGPALLSVLGADAAMLPHALEYLRVRALACPAVMVMCVAQGACLGQQDSWTPLKIFAFAGVFNLVGDLYLILQAGWGVAGAAWATMAAQYVGAGLFLRSLHKSGQTARGVPLQWHGIPSVRALRPFLTVGGTLFSRTMLQMMAYSAISYSAMALGTLATAAHQVALQVFWFLSYFPEPLSITAQSLIARDLQQPQRVRRLARSLLKVGAVMGLMLGAAGVAVYAGAPRLFTNDPAVIAMLRNLTAQVFTAELLCAMVMVCDGVSIGSGDFKHLPRVGVAATTTVVAMLWGCTRMGLGLGGVWCGMSLFFAIRLAMHAVHIYRNWKTSVLGAGPVMASAAARA